MASNLNITFRGALAALALSATLASCGRDPEDTGLEYAPQMYHSIAYDDYTQITDTSSEEYNSNPYNKHRQNMRKPAPHTVARKVYEGTPTTVLAADIMEYNIPSADSMAWSERNLKNPYTGTPEMVEEGKVLYGRFCAHCHGATGAGDGKVSKMYPGVPNYSSPAIARLNEGHLYHTITYGKGRMWPHGSQVMPQDRWKIVLYVQQLQKGGAAAPAADSSAAKQ